MLLNPSKVTLKHSQTIGEHWHLRVGYEPACACFVQASYSLVDNDFKLPLSECKQKPPQA